MSISQDVLTAIHVKYPATSHLTIDHDPSGNGYQISKGYAVLATVSCNPSTGEVQLLSGSIPSLAVLKASEATPAPPSQSAPPQQPQPAPPRPAESSPKVLYYDRLPKCQHSGVGILLMIIGGFAVCFGLAAALLGYYAAPLFGVGVLIVCLILDSIISALRMQNLLLNEILKRMDKKEEG